MNKRPVSFGCPNRGLVNKIRKSITSEIEKNLELSFNENKVKSSIDNELSDVYADFNYKKIEKSNDVREIRLVDSISDGLKEAMLKYEDLIIMGQDIAEYGGVFKITEGFIDLFGKNRIRNTPICESSIIEIAMGLSICDRKSIVELQFSDFITSGFNPVVNYLAKSHYRWGQKADIVLRMPCGAGVGAGPFHSQTNEAWFTKTPGLIVIYPSSPEDAKGLLISAIENPNPVLFFEHKALYRSIRGNVPVGYYNIEIGKAKMLNVGADISIITYGSGVYEALKTIKKLDLNADLIDLRTLAPLDKDCIISSVNKTGKAIILQEDSLFGGIASDISSIIMENCFENLDAPVIRVGRFESEILKLISY